MPIARTKTYILTFSKRALFLTRHMTLDKRFFYIFFFLFFFHPVVLEHIGK